MLKVCTMTTPCKEGYWTFGTMKCCLNILEGSQISTKNIVCLDYPDVPGTTTMDIKYGDCGEAKKEVAEASGATRYNINMKCPWWEINGVVNDARLITFEFGGLFFLL